MLATTTNVSLTPLKHTLGGKKQHIKNVKLTSAESSGENLMKKIRKNGATFKN